jgi:hypothetical protein
MRGYIGRVSQNGGASLPLLDSRQVSLAEQARCDKTAAKAIQKEKYFDDPPKAAPKTSPRSNLSIRISALETTIHGFMKDIREMKRDEEIY